MDLLSTIIELSHEFGGRDYVKGGGGNTSAKDDRTLWVKPSGTTLAGLTEKTLVAMSRAKIDELYGVETPQDAAAREELVKNMMAAAVKNDAGRPSVEAPLHNVFAATYVVHTHPCSVNGMTCAKEGQAACTRLFPDALWVEYIDPGYTLCMVVRERIEAYKAANGREPALLFLQNHGVFIAADTADEIRVRYARIMKALDAEYKKAGLAQSLAVTAASRDPESEKKIRALFGREGECMATCGPFDVAPGPITPDHLVYAKAFPFTGPLTAEAVDRYRTERGYAPKIIVAAARVFGIGNSQKSADLALEMAQDGALIIRLADAFGGVNYMSDAEREFIENWEVESYRAGR